MQESVWRIGIEPPSFPRLERTIDVDVAIVGGGITGLTAATLLKRAGKTVAVLEARRVGDGVTGRTSAHLTVALDERLSTLAARHGEEGARMAVESCAAAIDRIDALSAGLAIDCDFRRVPAFRFTEAPVDLAELDDETRRYQQAGVKACRQDGLPFSSLAVGAMRLEDQAIFHPLKYLEGLAMAVAGDGSHVFERTRVTKWEDGAPCRLRTEAGATVTARDVIIATHSPVGLLLSLHTRLEPLQSYVIVARVDDPPPLGLYFDTNEPYHYIRAYSPEIPDLLVIGGADIRSGGDVEAACRYQMVEEFARSRFDVRAIERRWSAVLFEPADGLPYIGKMPGASHAWCSTGYSGTGLTFGTVGGMLLSDLLLGHENRWSELYRPSRLKPLASAQRVVKENAVSAYRFIADRLTSAPVTNTDDLARGEGQMVRGKGGKKIALYRDPCGGLHAMSPRCPHAGCLVAWNGADKTWDCPCHGSRFNAEGKVIDGPAMSDLKRLDAAEELAPPVEVPTPEPTTAEVQPRVEEKTETA